MPIGCISERNHVYICLLVRKVTEETEQRAVYVSSFEATFVPIKNKMICIIFVITVFVRGLFSCFIERLNTLNVAQFISVFCKGVPSE